ncbi:ATP-dependent DNA ligase [Cryobacterium adonitolivorans]|uniref:ATP-dependent DNA ligase n=1 Tax=Cryobacterium adonitolivorans TaxID=1259189 RepID=A0A4R8W789_9MICO|nr:ATP-dependent DNA ligase [Cryobacterium adonitolivorans]TFC04019.1 ATP-dependent DNA ligase [Cryobacterium adonitolivorans]
MGRFIYDSTLTLTLDDALLGHLQAVVGAKFRLQQSFYFSWGYPANTGESRTMIWLTPSISVQFHYRTARPPALDRDRISEFLAQANSPSGLVLVIGD